MRYILLSSGHLHPTSLSFFGLLCHLHRRGSRVCCSSPFLSPQFFLSIFFSPSSLSFFPTPSFLSFLSFLIHFFLLLSCPFLSSYPLLFCPLLSCPLLFICFVSSPLLFSHPVPSCPLLSPLLPSSPLLSGPLRASTDRPPGGHHAAQKDHLPLCSHTEAPRIRARSIAHCEQGSPRNIRGER